MNSSDDIPLRCLSPDHPALPVGAGKKIRGGSCLRPPAGADIYVGFQCGMPTGPNSRLHVIKDGHAPPNFQEFKDLVSWVSQQLDAGLKVHVGCLAGHGRTGMFLAALVAARRVSDDPIAYVRKNYCPFAVETQEQVDFLVNKFRCKAALPSDQ